MNFLTSSVVRGSSGRLHGIKAEESEDFADVQRSHVHHFREHHPDGSAARASQGLIVVPADSASSDQRAKYAAYAEARLARTATPQGPQRLMFAPDLVGTSEQIAEQARPRARLATDTMRQDRSLPRLEELACVTA
jgi:hypothetical protein